ncbi:MAG: spermidine synthase, partial [Planctomycetota bacterium]
MNSKRLGQFATGLVFATTIFLGAFLLFQVQPLIGRFLLPWFGGSPEVWTTCMLFFQVFLLAGYAYAHWLIRIRQTTLQAVIHIGLLAAALLFLPILPKESFKPTAGDTPVMQILLICSLTVGVPYLLLSATSPLVQAWFSRAFPHRNPYRLYALSNTGSLLALVSFPFIFEPLLSRVQTAHLWSIVFAVFAVLCTAAAWLGGNHSNPTQSTITPLSLGKPKTPAATRWWLWVALPATASVELLAVTNKITQDIAVVPFLWILPLALYLLSFIICFEHQRWYKRRLFVPLFILSMIAVIYAHLNERNTGVYEVIGVYVFMLFACCMVCHGELHQLRTEPKHLTRYYLMIAVGGAIGGVFVAVVCPLIFNVYIELYLGLLFCTMLLLLIDPDIPASQKKRRPYWIAALVVMG